MIVGRYFPRTEEELRDLVLRETAGARSVVVQAGHFLLHHNVAEDRLEPYLSTSLTEPSLDPHGADRFPFLSWQLGLRLLRSIDAEWSGILTVVNDWQYVPPHLDRRSFYREHPNVPDCYFATLREIAPRVGILRPPQSAGTGMYFGEMNLRHRYKRSVERLIKSGRLPSHVAIASRDGGLICTLTDALGTEQEVYCATQSGDCASEIAQMLHSARSLASCDCFINLYPLVCQTFVERGTELGQEVLNNGIPTVINVGLPTSGLSDTHSLLASGEVSVHKFNGA